MRLSSAVCITVLALFSFLLLVDQSPPLVGSSAYEEIAISTRIEVDPTAGAFTRTTFERGSDSFVFDHSSGETILSDPTVQWTVSDGGLNYIPTTVTLGGRGNLAFYGCYLNNERTRLLSTTASNQADAPVWSDDGMLDVWSDINVDASENGNVLVSLAQWPVEGDITNRQVIVNKYTSNSPVPDWTYTFDDTINSGAKVKVSADGAYIAAALFDDENGTMKLAFFDSDSSTPLFTDSFASTFIRAMDITDDGSKLYINEGANVHIYDTSTQSIIFTVNAGASFDSHTLSGDGSRFAFGGFNFVKCYEWTGTTYSLQFTYNVSGSVYCSRCDLSGDASTLAAAFYFYSPGLTFKVVSIDATTGSADYEADFTGSGAYQNAPYQIVANADGSRIVYGGWGDQYNTNPEVMVFEGSATPTAMIDTRGSVFDVDTDANGVYAASGSKSIHANVSGNGGDHACLYMGGQDLYLDGVPSISETVTFKVEGNEGERVRLAASFNEVNIVTPIGTLMVDPNQYFQLRNDVIGPSGMIEFDVTVPNSQGLIGRKVVTQVLFTGGGSPRLSNGQVFWVLP